MRSLNNNPTTEIHYCWRKAITIIWKPITQLRKGHYHYLKSFSVILPNSLAERTAIWIFVSLIPLLFFIALSRMLTSPPNILFSFASSWMLCKWSRSAYILLLAFALSEHSVWIPSIMSVAFWFVHWCIHCDFATVYLSVLLFINIGSVIRVLSPITNKQCCCEAFFSMSPSPQRTSFPRDCTLGWNYWVRELIHFSDLLDDARLSSKVELLLCILSDIGYYQDSYYLCVWNLITGF